MASKITDVAELPVLHAHSRCDPNFKTKLREKSSDLLSC